MNHTFYLEASAAMKVRESIRRLETYNPPLDIRTERDYLLLDFSESTRAPDAAVGQALKDYIDGGRLRMYPAYGRFVEHLAEYAGARPDEVLPTNGSDGAIQLVTQALLEDGDEVIMAQPGFFVIESCARACGATVIAPSYRQPGMDFPFEEIRAAITPKTKLIVVINPNNPTGTTVPMDQIETLLRENPETCVMVDEAYHEFSGLTAIPLLPRYPNLVVTRTFSKAFALAGLRLGYVVARAEFISEINKIRIPYDVNSLAVVAAEVQLRDQESWRGYVSEVMEKAKPMVERFFDEVGVTYVPSQANFLLVRPDDVQGAFQALQAANILVRPQRGMVADCFRMSIGTVAEMERFISVYREFLAGRGKQAAGGAP